MRYEWKLKRKGKDLTLKQLSKVVGVSISMLSRYENNERDLQPEQERLYKEYINSK